MRLILFDCDGTLLDSQHLIIAAMEAAFNDMKLAPPTNEAVRSIVGLSLENAIHQLHPQADQTLLSNLCASYRAAHRQLRSVPDPHEPLYDGVADTVRILAARDDLLLGIATGKSRPGLISALERHNLRSSFTILKTADDAPSKPHPAMIEQAMAETGTQAEKTLMIGDTTFDMTMARHANVRALGVSWGYHPVSELLEAGAHDIAETFPQIVKFIDRAPTQKEPDE